MKESVVAAPWILALNSVGEPDAVVPHVRFDEREVETEHGVRF